MITREKMDEWIREIDERPTSALEIVRYIAARLSHLSQRNEELLAENIQLRSQQKVEEYEARIASLEYQLDLLKRQLGGEGDQAAPAAETLSLLVYNALGMVLRIELIPERLAPGFVAGRLAALAPETGEEAKAPAEPRLLLAGSNEELLFLFNTGRTLAIPVASIPPCAAGEEVVPLGWSSAFREEPRGAEELVAIAPIGRISLSHSAVQVSRRGLVKKMMRPAFEILCGEKLRRRWDHPA